MNHEIAKNIRDNLTANCMECFGLCCTALNIVASSDFAITKTAGTPCPNLQDDFRCVIHKNLRDKGFKGCTVFDCLGAGQKVSQVTFKGQSWRKHPEIAKKMFRVFPVMEQLFEMIAFIAEALTYKVSHPLQIKLNKQLEILQSLTDMDADRLLAVDITKCRQPVNELLLEASDNIRGELSSKVYAINKGKNFRGIDWMGKRLTGRDLRTTDLRGAYLIASNLRDADLRGVDFIGADLRDADLSGANLSTGLFLTQMQINSAKGNGRTKLPSHIQIPSHWMN